MADEALIDRLASVQALKDVPRSELAWLAERGSFRTIDLGGAIVPKDRDIENMSVVLEGRAGLYVNTGIGRRKIIEAHAGQIVGLLPYSRLQRAPGETVVEEPVTMFDVHREHVLRMPIECPGLTAALVHHMVDRARDFRSAQMIDERLQSLGKLASGLAPELYTPASAAARHAR